MVPTLVVVLLIPPHHQPGPVPPLPVAYATLPLPPARATQQLHQHHLPLVQATLQQTQASLPRISSISNISSILNISSISNING